MADDTRLPREDLSREALTVSPENRPFTGTQWQNGKQVPYVAPPENANLMPGGTAHTAGGKVPEATLGNAFGTVKVEEFKQLHKRPCVRDAYMTGIGAGFGVGGVRALFGAKIWSSCNWAVGAWILGSAGMYQYCLYKRQAEKEGMMRAVEILNKKDVEKRARESRKEKMREERRKAKDEELDAKLGAGTQTASASTGNETSWWKVW